MEFKTETQLRTELSNAWNLFDMEKEANKRLREQLAAVSKLSTAEAAILIPAVMEYCEDMDRQLAKAQKDAERYQWLLRQDVEYATKGRTGIEAAIDAAIAKEKAE